MKKIIFSILVLFLLFIQQSKGQEWCHGAPNYTLDMISNESELIFEGRVLSDSVFALSPPGEICTYHRVLVLKQFKGQFASDTVNAFNGGGRMLCKDRAGYNHWEGEVGSFAQKGDEAVFFVSSKVDKKFTGNNPSLFLIICGSCGMVKVCDKKDVVKEVYEPIEAATGQPYIDVHPNSCKGQQSQQK